jgi:hypothetical protein
MRYPGFALSYVTQPIKPAEALVIQVRCNIGKGAVQWLISSPGQNSANYRCAVTNKCHLRTTRPNKLHSTYSSPQISSLRLVFAFLFLGMFSSPQHYNTSIKAHPVSCKKKHTMDAQNAPPVSKDGKRQSLTRLTLLILCRLTLLSSRVRISSPFCTQLAVQSQSEWSSQNAPHQC